MWWRSGLWMTVLVVVSCAGEAAEPMTTPTTELRAITSSTSTPTTTTLTVSASTREAQPTTTTSQPAPLCRPTPFTSSFARALDDDYPGALITAHVYDTRTGCSYSLNPDNRQRTASVFKIMVMAGTLLEAQKADRELTDWEMGQLEPMITQSTNPQVRALWRSFGAGAWFTDQAATFGLTETTVEGEDGVTPWGRTHTAASDQVDLVRQVLLGHWGPLDSDSRAVALDLMRSVVPDQTWGITAGLPEDWTVAQKNGFAGPIINSVGWVDEPGPSEGYVVAILTEGWRAHAIGIAVVERIAEAVSQAMLLPGRFGLPDGVE